MTQKITPFIRSESNATELAQFYLITFSESKLCEQNFVVTTIEIFGQTMGFINGGPLAKPNPSISFSLRCIDKELTKQIRDKLVDGGTVLMEFGAYPRSESYGRCNDKYGVSRQIMHDTRPGRSSQIVPSLMYTQNMAGKAEEAINFYATVFPNSEIEFLRRYEAGSVDKEGTLNHAEFKLAGQQFIAMDSAGPHAFVFTDGVSLSVSCKDQAEVDYYREKLISDGGQESACGRGKDKYGVSRQIIPVQLPELLFHPDAKKSQKAMQAMMLMKKIIIADLV